MTSGLQMMPGLQITSGLQMTSGLHNYDVWFANDVWVADGIVTVEGKCCRLRLKAYVISKVEYMMMHVIQLDTQSITGGSITMQMDYK